MPRRRSPSRAASAGWAARAVESLRRDPWPALCGSAALVVYLLHGLNGYLSRDVAVYAYAGQRVAEGVPPYEGIINRSGPLAHMIPGVGALVARIIGVEDLLAMRVLFMALAIACVVLAYLLGRDLFSSRMAGVSTAAALLCFLPFIRLATEGPREKTALALFILAALLAVVHRRWLTTGLLVSLATLTWQAVFFVLMPGVLVALLLGARTGRVKALVRVAAGGLAPLAVAFTLYALAGSVRLFLDCFALINLRYTRQPPFFNAAAANVRELSQAFGWSLVVVAIGALALLALAVVDLFHDGGRRARERPAVLASAVTLAAALLWSARAFNNWPDSFILLPGAALGIGALTSVLTTKVPYKAARAVTVAWIIGATGASLIFSITDREPVLEYQKAEVVGALESLPPGSRIMSLGAPQALVLSDQRNPTRLQMISTGLEEYIDDTRPGGLEGYARWIKAQRPALIVMTPGGVPDWLKPTFEGRYRPVGTTLKWRWFARRDLGPDTTRAVRDALNTSSDPASLWPELRRLRGEGSPSIDTTLSDPE